MLLLTTFACPSFFVSTPSLPAQAHSLSKSPSSCILKLLCFVEGMQPSQGGFWRGVWGGSPQRKINFHKNGTQKSGTKNELRYEHKSKLLSPIFYGGVGVFHVKGWGPKSSVCPSKPGESNFFGGLCSCKHIGAITHSATYDIILVRYPKQAQTNYLRYDRAKIRKSGWGPEIHG